APGTYYYSARSTKMSLHDIGVLSIIEDLSMGEGPFGIESQLEGAFIVDQPGVVPNDRIFMITNWMEGVITPPFREVVVINGKSWPYTERLSYRTGETTSIVWSPDRPGNCLLHCHMTAHMSSETAAAVFAGPHAPDHDSPHHSGGMGGLILGITVSGPKLSSAAIPTP